MSSTNPCLGRQICRCLQPSYRVKRHLFFQRKLLSEDRTVGNGRLSRVLQAYEDIVGLSEVRAAQANVIKAEDEFVQAQSERKMKQLSLAKIQSRLRTVGTERENAVKGDQNYLNLTRKENKLLGEIQYLEQQIASTEQSENDKFALLSVAIQISHDKERAKAKRTRYWSIIGSAIGVTVGILGTSVNDYMRMRELRAMIKDSSEQGSAFRDMESTQSDMMKAQFTRIEEQIDELNVITHSTVTLEKQTKEILEIVKYYDRLLEAEKNGTTHNSVIQNTALCAGVAVCLAIIVNFFNR